MVAKLLLGRRTDERARFWTWQVISLVSLAVFTLGFLSIWFREPGSLTTAAGLFTAALAFSLQKVITSFAAYFIILRGRNFSVGDRIVMGGVRGDVIALGFMQTTIMEMVQAIPEQADAQAIWVKSRQYTGRIVTITNDKIFEKPVYNYSRDFPYIWEEMTLPIKYGDDCKRVEAILLEAAERYTLKISELSKEALDNLRERYFLHDGELRPRVYMRLTDNWVEFTVRFITHDHGTRDLKDAMSRDILDALDKAGIGIATRTYEIVGVPPIKVEVERDVMPDGGRGQE